MQVLIVLNGCNAMKNVQIKSPFAHVHLRTRASIHTKSQEIRMRRLRGVADTGFTSFCMEILN